MPADFSEFTVEQDELLDPDKEDNLLAKLADTFNSTGDEDKMGWAPGAILLPSQLKQEGATDGQVFVWDSALGKWKPDDVSGAGGGRLDLKKRTSGATSNATTAATAIAIITGNTVTYTGDEVFVEFWAPYVQSSVDSGSVFAVFYCDEVEIGKARPLTNESGANDMQLPPYLTCFHTPTADDHVYSLRAFVNAGTATFGGGAGGADTYLPSWLRVTKA